MKAGITVFALSAGPRPSAGKKWAGPASFPVGPASFPSFSCLKVVKDEIRAGKFSNLNAMTGITGWIVRWYWDHNTEAPLWRRNYHLRSTTWRQMLWRQLLNVLGWFSRKIRSSGLGVGSFNSWLLIGWEERSDPWSIWIVCEGPGAKYGPYHQHPQC